MKFANKTPFDALCYQMVDKNDAEYNVFVAKVGFNLIQQENGEYRVDIQDENSVPLSFQDVYAGEMNKSAVLVESDLAPYKPYCDVVINATAYAPGGKACSAFSVKAQLTSLDGEITLWSKEVDIIGERRITRNSLTAHHISQPKPFLSLPINYQYAFGGECVIDKQDKRASRIDKKYQLTEEQLIAYGDFPPCNAIAHTACMSNPIGLGFCESWYLDVIKEDCWSAPRIMNVGRALSNSHISKMLKGKMDLSDPVYSPAGFGFIGRGWSPRLAKAGTYDQEWIDNRHPHLPHDFDFNYWNGAPEDQQVVELPSGLHVSITNVRPDGEISFNLPNHLAFILLRAEQGVIPQPMKLDTLLIDTESLTVHLTYRYLIKADIPISAAEFRYEIHPLTLLDKLYPRSSV
ncbi:DUF2169 family type VI secretion system accessory protein [Pragia fontium]|uniref:DUF2169 domain-containing protein n=2 Tax=Pragia fontium TaxID=82985 RepID=A0AAJ4W8L6_9GAMM|nr:DUF2169 domain-containing protein [Pragia fontium]GKX63159.1 hypothetical protein SOASR032_17280 [Pragia fontium]SFC31427.1 hypothetical protein SAMN02745723_10242 [Pragia fontium DSM 5563 = ATCC 49100]VEJ54417.1 Uncharacterized protein conserved in bacteria [Pragia fontium]